MNKTNKSSLFKTSVFAALVAGAMGAHAAGLGKLTVYSAIGQPLNAELAVTASPEELSSLTAKLAPHSAFRDAGIELMPALTGLRFNVVKNKGQSVLRLSTDVPLNEPFLHFLVELNWSSGRVIREYTFLLDPPEMLQVAKPASVVTPVVPQGQSIKVQPVPSRAAPVVEAPSPASVPVQGGKASAVDYQVKSGDTLGKIARETRPEGVTLDQMLVALFNNNRDAFDGNNMNRLRAGRILKVPDAADVATVVPAEARKLVINQAADFNAYRRRLAEATASTPAADAVASQQSGGKIKPQVETKAPAAPVADKLEVSRTESLKSAKSASKANLEEDLVARDKQLREASERIAQLEKNLENLKKLTELKTQAGAQAQQQAEASKPAQPVAEKKPEPAPAPVAAPAVDKPAATVAPPASDVKPAEAAPAVKSEAAPAAAAEKPADAPKPAPSKPVAPPPPIEPEPSFVDENPELVFGSGGLLALLLGYFGFAAWKRKKQAQQTSFEDTGSITQTAGVTPVAAVPAAVVDNGEVSILGDFSESASLIAEENVDPVAEADVLLAYGRDKQAEEILLEGLKTDPQNSAIHLKLLEVYAQRKDEAQFQVAAEKLHDQTGGQGPEWEKAVAIASFLGIAGGIFADGDVTVTDLPIESPAAESEGTVVLAEPPLAEAAAPVAPSDDLEFDLDLGSTSMAAAPVADHSVQVSEPVASAMPETQSADGIVTLDFDFDMEVAPAAVISAADSPVVPAVEVAADDSAVEFDLPVDLGDADVLDAASPDVSPVQAEPVPAPVNEVSSEDGAIDFSIDLSDAPAAEVAEAPVSAVTTDVAAGGLDFDFDLGVADASPAPTPAMDAPLDLGDISLDLDDQSSVAAAPAMDLSVTDSSSEVPEMDFDLDLGSGVQDVEPASMPVKDAGALSVDLPDMDLSLDVPDAVEPVRLEVGSAGGIPDLDLGADLGGEAQQVESSSSEQDDPEVATKLELAQAYEEMGDREGARELLNEVLNEGSSAQRASASARLERLAG